MRLAAYAGVRWDEIDYECSMLTIFQASTVLAAGVVLKAFHERPNFYSASVYLFQSSACRMV